MMDEIYNPLELYQKEYKEKFRQICQDTFKELKDLSKVDAARNKETCNLIRKSRSTHSGRHTAQLYLAISLRCCSIF